MINDLMADLILTGGNIITGTGTTAGVAGRACTRLNGSKMRSWSSGSIPTALSRTEMTTSSRLVSLRRLMKLREASLRKRVVASP